jgi:hypothetical protein
LILSIVWCVCAAGAQNAQASHGRPSFLPGWVLWVIDGNSDGMLNIYDDPMFVVASVIVPSGAASVAASVVLLARVLRSSLSGRRDPGNGKP